LVRPEAGFLFADWDPRACEYEARKLNNPPMSLYDYHDAMRGREPPDERRARERRDNRPPR